MADEPGAARQGNFINYYRFNPAENRLKYLDPNLLEETQPKLSKHDVLALDIGCNTGELSSALARHLRWERGHLHIHGVDIDETLIERAKQIHADKKALVTFERVDMMDSSVAEERLAAVLAEHGKARFDMTFVFSVTMWIHLNYGDAGLSRFIRQLADCSAHVLLEPQPWKCYQTAARRMRKLKQPEFEHMKAFDARDDDALQKKIVDMCSEHGLEVVRTLGQSEWKRTLLLLKNVNACD